VTPSPFQIGQAIGSNIGQVQERQTDLTAIDQILAQAGQSGNQQTIDTAMNQILSRVSPQRQKSALDILNQRRERIIKDQSKQQEIESFRRAGLDPKLAELPADIRKERIKSIEAERRLGELAGDRKDVSAQDIIEGKQPEEKGLFSLSDDQLVRLSSDPVLSRPASEELKRRQADTKANLADIRERRKELAPFIKTISDQADATRPAMSAICSGTPVACSPPLTAGATPAATIF